MPKIKTKKVLRRSKENLRHFNKSEIADRELEETENLVESNLDGEASNNIFDEAFCLPNSEDEILTNDENFLANELISVDPLIISNENFVATAYTSRVI